MEKRRGISISFKMILTTASLVLVIVSLFGTINACSVNRVYDEQAQLLSDALTRSIEKRGRVQTKDLVQASRSAILQNDFSTLQAFVPEVVKDDPEVLYAIVADKDGTVQAHSDRDRNGKPLTDAVARDLVVAKEPVARRIDAQKLYVFSRPILHDGQKLGAVVIAFNLVILDQQIAKMQADKDAAKTASVTRTAAIGLCFVLLGLALSIFQSVRISRPLKVLAWRADQIARGDLDTRVETSSSDEIGMLGENFNYMADQLVVLLRETAQKAIIEKELEVARAIQETLVPSGELVDRKTLKVAGFFLPASQTGGDWWTVHDLVDDKVLVVIGDVTGHGVPAAMITAAAKAACDTIRAVTQGKLTVTYLLEAMNHAIFEAARRKFVMTCFASIVDTRARTITYANAGHNFPYLFRPQAGNEAQDFHVLMSRGNRLGDLAESTYTEKTEQLQPGDTLVWYSDGIVECESPQGEEYGEKRFRAAIRRAAGLEPVEMREAVVGAASQFFGDRQRKDDITMVFGRIYA
ncbi:MAG: HAMP domain-containing protein [Myxococcales bacterium]|nr:HAMP domain-containing protein [Myxococcales bacterium]